MNIGELYAGLNALDVALVKRNPDGTFAGLKEGSETLGIPTVITNPLTGRIEKLDTGAGKEIALPGLKLQAIKGVEILDFANAGFLPASTAFSGAGTYASAGRLAVQSTGEIRHNPTGWSDGSPCIEFTPNADTAEFRLYFDNTTGFKALDFNDTNGIALEFEVLGVDTSKTNFSVGMEFSNDAANAFPSNKAGLGWWRNDSPGTAQSKENAGRKYYRFRFDSLATDIKCGTFPGYGYTANAGGTGADWTKPVNYLRLTVNKFAGQTVRFKRLLRGGWSTPCLIIGTDNAGPEPLVTLAAPLFAKNRVAGYANQYWDQLDISPAALDRFKRLYAAGWEIDGNDVVDRPLGDAVLDQPTMASAIATTKSRCLASGWVRGSRVWVANNNSTSYLMIRELQAAGYVANRNGIGEGRYCFPEGGIPDPFRLPSPSCDSKTLADIQPMIDRCEEYGATMWLYFHNTWAKAQIDADRTNNITGTAGAPIAVNAGETAAQYRARALALGTAIGTATVAYMDARIGSTASLCIWFEDLSDIINYVGTRQKAGGLITLTPTEWAHEVGLL